MAEKALNILVLAGGESGEREVSLASARAIVAALTTAGHTVKVLDTLNGSYLNGTLTHSLDDDRYTTGKLPATAVRNDVALTRELIRGTGDGIDVVFNGLHGGFGENGSISALLDLLGVPYTGSPMAASAIAMNKDISKRIMQSMAVPTAPWQTYVKGKTPVADMAREILTHFDPPLIIKPTDGGSTVGLSLVEDASQLETAIDDAFGVADSIMAEEYVRGREITIAILDGRALAPVEIRPSHTLYDYTCKYTKGKSEYFCPADIDAAITKKLADDAMRFYSTIGCRGYARVDFIVAPDGSYVCLELNTLPGMTELSLFPMAAREAGLEFGELLVTLCRLAMKGK